VQANDLIALATVGRNRSRFFLELPTVFEATRLNAEQEWLFDFRHRSRASGAPGGATRDAGEPLSFLEAATAKAVSDPQFLAEGVSVSSTRTTSMPPAPARTP